MSGLSEETTGSEVRGEKSPEQSNYRRRMEIFTQSTRFKRTAIEDEIHRDIFWDSHSMGEYARRCQQMRITPDMELWREINP